MLNEECRVEVEQMIYFTNTSKKGAKILVFTFLADENTEAHKRRMKYNCQGLDPITLLKCTLPKIGDTKIEHVSIDDFWEEMDKDKKKSLA